MEMILFVALICYGVWYYSKPKSTRPRRPFMESLGQLVGAVMYSPTSPEHTQHRPTARPQTQPFSDSGPIEGMFLKLKRGEKSSGSSWLGKPTGAPTYTFTLDARMEVSVAIRGRIEKYQLGNRIIYESTNREKYAQRARQHAENTQDQPGLSASPGAQAWGFAKTMGRLGAAAANATFSAFSLRVTVNSLMKGVHIECKDMGELLEAEDAIKEAAANLEEILKTATTFTGGEEEVIKFGN